MPVEGISQCHLLEVESLMTFESRKMKMYSLLSNNTVRKQNDTSHVMPDCPLIVNIYFLYPVMQCSYLHAS